MYTVKLFFALLVLASSLLAAPLRVATLNAYFLSPPDEPVRSSLRREPMSPEQYRTKVVNLATLIDQSGADVVALEEVTTESAAAAVAGKLESFRRGARWRVAFVQGRDTYTGQNVAVLLREDGGNRVGSAARAGMLDQVLSKHLVVHYTAAGRKYVIVAVHCIRPIGTEIRKHELQLSALTDYVKAQQANDASATVIVMGDFNDARPALPYPAANALVEWRATHLAGKPYDQIYSTGKFSQCEILRPPYGVRPNDLLKTLWTDHFLICATLE